MNVTLQRDDFIVDKKGMSLFYYVLEALNIPMAKRDRIDQVDIKVVSFETFMDDEELHGPGVKKEIKEYSWIIDDEDVGIII